MLFLKEKSSQSHKSMKSTTEMKELKGVNVTNKKTILVASMNLLQREQKLQGRKRIYLSLNHCLLN